MCQGKIRDDPKLYRHRIIKELLKPRRHSVSHPSIILGHLNRKKDKIRKSATPPSLNGNNKEIGEKFQDFLIEEGT